MGRFGPVALRECSADVSRNRRVHGEEVANAFLHIAFDDLHERFLVRNLEHEIVERSDRHGGVNPFIRTNPMRDYTVPVKGLTRGRRIPSLLRRAYGERLVEELPKEFRCVSVDLLGRRTVVHRRGPVADVVGCSLRLPGIFPPYVYDGTLHVDGGVLDNLPVSTLAGTEGPLVGIAIGFGGDATTASATEFAGPPRIPGIAETLIRTMTMGSGLAAASTLAQADIVIRPSTRGVGLLEFHQIDQAREAGRAAAREALPQILALAHR